MFLRLWSCVRRMWAVSIARSNLRSFSCNKNSRCQQLFTLQCALFVVSRLTQHTFREKKRTKKTPSTMNWLLCFLTNCGMLLCFGQYCNRECYPEDVRAEPSACWIRVDALHSVVFSHGGKYRYIESLSLSALRNKSWIIIPVKYHPVLQLKSRRGLRSAAIFSSFSQLPWLVARWLTHRWLLPHLLK